MFLERSPASSSHHFQPSFDGFHFDPPPTHEYAERANDADVNLNASNTTIDVQYDNVYVPFHMVPPLLNIMTDWTSSFVV